jgi:Exostosin family
MRLTVKVLFLTFVAYALAVTSRLLRVVNSDYSSEPSTRSKRKDARLDIQRSFRNTTARCQQTPRSAVLDPTVVLPPCLFRPWIDQDRPTLSKPPIKLLATNFGWNSKDSLQHARSRRSRELWEAVLKHPLFDPAADWDEYSAAGGRQGLDPHGTRYYVFLDIETCFESNYPTFGATDYEINYDTDGGRRFHLKEESECYEVELCSYISLVLSSDLFQRTDATLVYFDCRGRGIPTAFRHHKQTSNQLAFASLSSAAEQVLSSIDQGLPPPFNLKATKALTEDQIKSIRHCLTDRPYLLTFVGDLQVDTTPLHSAIASMDDADRRIRILTPVFLKRRFGLGTAAFMKLSRYVIVPKGDNNFSYNFVEAIASGAIPVVYSDHWVFPFRQELVDWSQCVVRIRENQVATTTKILSQLSPAQECRRRQYCYYVYQRYLSSPDAVLDGILQGLESAKSPL